MSSNGNYPLGAKYDPAAPWNEPEPKKVKVFITTTFGRETEVEVPVTYTSQDLDDAVREQIGNPLDLLKEIACNNPESCIMEREITSWELVDYTIDEIDYV